jgi:PTS system galactitol-specific IIC component
VHIVTAFVQSVFTLGAAVVMPIILFILAIIFRQPVGKSARAALTVGAAFIAIFAILGAVFGLIGPIVQSMGQNFGLSLTGVDVGWPVAAAIIWGVSFSAAIIPIAFIINICMLFLNLTKTFDADVWNYKYWAFAAVVIYMWTKNMILAWAVAIIVEIIVLKLADWMAPLTQTYFGIPGTSLPHIDTADWGPINLAAEKLIFSRIPVLQKVKADPETLTKKFGVFAEPIMLGFYIGILLGILGKQSIVNTFQVGIYLAALMFLQGRMIGFLMEGLMPIINGVQESFSKIKRFAGKEIFIGIDAGPIGISNPTAVFVGYLLLPVVLLLGFFPGNKILPLADLAVLPILIMFAAMASRGNILKTIFNSLITIVGILYIANAFAAPLTEAAKLVGFAIPAGMVLISSLDVGSNILLFILVMPIIGFASGKPTLAIIPIIIGVIYALAWFYAKDQPVKLAQKIKEDQEIEEEQEIKEEQEIEEKQEQ